MPYAETAITVELATPAGPLRVHNVHIPNGRSHKWKKIESFEGIHRGLSEDPRGAQILCGDFNSPQREFPSGVVATFGQRILPGEIIVSERKRAEPPDRWALGERSVILGLEEFGFFDAFRSLHGYENDAYSWVLRRKGKISRRRFDHIFASESLRPSSCRYIHGWRRLGLSDHSAIEAEFAIERADKFRKDERRPRAKTKVTLEWHCFKKHTDARVRFGPGNPP